MFPAAGRIMIGESHPRIDLQRQRLQVRIGGRLRRLQSPNRLQAGLRDVSGANQSRRQSKMRLYSPVPMQKEVWCGAIVEDLGKVLQRLGVILLMQLSVLLADLPCRGTLPRNGLRGDHPTFPQGDLGIASRGNSVIRAFPSTWRTHRFSARSIWYIGLSQHLESRTYDQCKQRTCIGVAHRKLNRMRAQREIARDLDTYQIKSGGSEPCK